MARLRERSLISILFITTVLQSSCNLFETRSPDPPEQSSSTFVPPVVDSLVFSNLIHSFSDLNSLNYLRCLADTATSSQSFQYEPTPQARARYGVFQAWSKQSEQQYFEKAKSQLQNGGVMTLEFLTLNRQALQSDSAQYDATYRLSVPHTISGISKQAVGRAQFYLIVDRSRYWVIRRWVDLAQNQTDFTWSEMKGTFAQ